MKTAVVGGCGSGKTTVVAKLREGGYDAYVVGQEHSAVQSLWQRQRPDALVFLDVSLEAVRQRRSRSWPAWLYQQQAKRLAHARSQADVVVDTSQLTIDQTVERIRAAIPLADPSDERCS